VLTLCFGVGGSPGEIRINLRWTGIERRLSEPSILRDVRFDATSSLL